MRNSATSAGCAALGIVLPRESTTKQRRARSFFCYFFRFLRCFVVYFSSFQCVAHCDMRDSTGKVALRSASFSPENQPRRNEEHEAFFVLSSFPSFLRGLFSSFQCVGHCDMKDSTGKVAQPAEVARVRQRAI